MLWLWGSERASEVTGARDGSAYGSLKKLTEAVEFKSLDREVPNESERGSGSVLCLLTLVLIPLAGALGGVSVDTVGYHEPTASRPKQLTRTSTLGARRSNSLYCL